MTTVRTAVIQCSANMSKDEAIDKHVGLIAEAAAEGAKVTTCRRSSTVPTSRPSGIQVVPDRRAGGRPDVDQDARGRQGASDGARRPVVRGGADRRLLQHGGRDRSRRHTARHTTARRTSRTSGRASGKFYFKPGNLGYLVFDTSVGKIGLIICYDRHFPEVARQVGLKGAEPSSIRRRPSSRSRSTSGNSSSRPTRSRTATGSRPSTGSASRSRCRARFRVLVLL